MAKEKSCGAIIYKNKNHVRKHLIILRGNSGSGKTTVAKELQERFGRGTMVLSQYMIRREVLKERDGVDPPTLPLIVERCFRNGVSFNQH